VGSYARLREFSATCEEIAKSLQICRFRTFLLLQRTAKGVAGCESGCDWGASTHAILTCPWDRRKSVLRIRGSARYSAPMPHLSVLHPLAWSATFDPLAHVGRPDADGAHVLPVHCAEPSSAAFRGRNRRPGPLRHEERARFTCGNGRTRRPNSTNGSLCSMSRPSSARSASWRPRSIAPLGAGFETELRARRTGRERDSRPSAATRSTLARRRATIALVWRDRRRPQAA
jgi:hypothetical protein